MEWSCCECRTQWKIDTPFTLTFSVISFSNSCKLISNSASVQDINWTVLNLSICYVLSMSTTIPLLYFYSLSCFVLFFVFFFLFGLSLIDSEVNLYTFFTQIIDKNPKSRKNLKCICQLEHEWTINIDNENCIDQSVLVSVDIMCFPIYLIIQIFFFC